MDLLKGLVDLWLKQIETAKKVKYDHFGRTAKLLRKFLGKNYRPFYFQIDEVDAETFPHITGPYHRVRISKTREFVSLMTPYVHAQVPNRLCTPRRPPLPPELVSLMPTDEMGNPLVPTKPTPDEQLQAWLMQWWLNYLVAENGLARETRLGVQEALSVGRGVVWHELYDGPYGEVPGSFNDSVDGLLCDPDAISWRDCGYIVRQRQWASWRVAEYFGIPVEKVRGKYESYWKSSAANAFGVKEGWAEAKDENRDIAVWYEVFSRVGPGHRFISANEDMKRLGETLDGINPHVYLAIMPGFDSPLNLQRDLVENALNEDEIKGRIEWPIAFHELHDPWPCTVLDFIPNDTNPWATSPLEAALPLQIFLDRLYSFVMSRVSKSSRDLVICSKALAEAFKHKIVVGEDLECVEFDGLPGVEIDKLLHLLKLPELNKDIWTVEQMVERAFERQTGMDPLLYGNAPSAQDRSAEATKTREAHLTSRPDDYADSVEAWQSAIAAKEAVASRLTLKPAVIAPLFRESITDSPQIDPETGQPGEIYGPLTKAWVQYLSTSDPAVAAAELTYEVEAGTGKRKNKAQQAQNAQTILQVCGQTNFAYGQATGDFEPYNGVVRMVGQWLDVSMESVLLPSVQAPQQPQGGPQSQPPEAPRQPSLPPLQ